MEKRGVVSGENEQPPAETCDRPKCCKAEKTASEATPGTIGTDLQSRMAEEVEARTQQK